MKYLLDQKEYDQIQEKLANIKKDGAAVVAGLCRIISNSNKWEAGTGRVCIRDGGTYCSGCPVKKVCTYNNKQWAK